MILSSHWLRTQIIGYTSPSRLCSNEWFVYIFDSHGHCDTCTKKEQTSNRKYKFSTSTKHSSAWKENRGSSMNYVQITRQLRFSLQGGKDTNNNAC